MMKKQIIRSYLFDVFGHIPNRDRIGEKERVNEKIILLNIIYIIRNKRIFI